MFAGDGVEEFMFEFAGGSDDDFHDMDQADIENLCNNDDDEHDPLLLLQEQQPPQHQQQNHQHQQQHQVQQQTQQLLLQQQQHHHQQQQLQQQLQQLQQQQFQQQQQLQQQQLQQQQQQHPQQPQPQRQNNFQNGNRANRLPGSSSKTLSDCVVCGDAANGKYFGALVCVPCKTFFLRYANESHQFHCKLRGNCDITLTTRTNCKYCRYRKCVDAGMVRKIRPIQIQLHDGQQRCVVCSDVANGIHFGALTCEGCKKFFRRGLTEHRTYTCKNNYECMVNPRTRNNCRYCRFNKCISVGMSREAIQMGRPSKMNVDPMIISPKMAAHKSIHNLGPAFEQLQQRQQKKIRRQQDLDQVRQEGNMFQTVDDINNLGGLQQSPPLQQIEFYQQQQQQLQQHQMQQQQMQQQNIFIQPQTSPPQQHQQLQHHQQQQQLHQIQHIQQQHLRQQQLQLQSHHPPQQSPHQQHLQLQQSINQPNNMFLQQNSPQNQHLHQQSPLHHQQQNLFIQQQQQQQSPQDQKAHVLLQQQQQQQQPQQCFQQHHLDMYNQIQNNGFLLRQMTLNAQLASHSSSSSSSSSSKSTPVPAAIEPPTQHQSMHFILNMEHCTPQIDNNTPQINGNQLVSTFPTTTTVSDVKNFIKFSNLSDPNSNGNIYIFNSKQNPLQDDMKEIGQIMFNPVEDDVGGISLSTSVQSSNGLPFLQWSDPAYSASLCLSQDINGNPVLNSTSNQVNSNFNKEIKLENDSAEDDHNSGITADIINFLENQIATSSNRSLLLTNNQNLSNNNPVENNGDSNNNNEVAPLDPNSFDPIDWSDPIFTMCQQSDISTNPEFIKMNQQNSNSSASTNEETDDFFDSNLDARASLEMLNAELSDNPFINFYNLDVDLPTTELNDPLLFDTSSYLPSFSTTLPLKTCSNLKLDPVQFYNLKQRSILRKYLHNIVNPCGIADVKRQLEEMRKNTKINSNIVCVGDVLNNNNFNTNNNLNHGNIASKNNVSNKENNNGFIVFKDDPNNNNAIYHDKNDLSKTKSNNNGDGKSLNSTNYGCSKTSNGSGEKKDSEVKSENDESKKNNLKQQNSADMLRIHLTLLKYDNAAIMSLIEAGEKMVKDASKNRKGIIKLSWMQDYNMIHKCFFSRERHNDKSVTPPDDLSLAETHFEVENTAFEGGLTMRDMAQMSQEYWRNLKYPRPDVEWSHKYVELYRALIVPYRKFVIESAEMNFALASRFVTFMSGNKSISQLSEFVEKTVVPNYTTLAMDYIKAIPGFTSIGQEDQRTIFRLAQSTCRILIAALHRFNPLKQTFYSEFLPWRRLPGQNDNFFKKLVSFARKIRRVRLDDNEECFFNAILIFALDYPGIKEPEKIQKISQSLLNAFRSYTTVCCSRGSRNTRLEFILSYAPEIRHIGLLHHLNTTHPDILNDPLVTTPIPINDCNVSEFTTDSAESNKYNVDGTRFDNSFFDEENSAH